MAGRNFGASLSFVSFLTDCDEGLVSCMETEESCLAQIEVIKVILKKAREDASSYMDDLTPRQVKVAKAAAEAAQDAPVTSKDGV